MENIAKCPVCGSGDIVDYLKTKDYFLSQESFGLMKCARCNLVFTNPRPAKSELGCYYESDQYLSHHASSWNFQAFVYRFLRRLNIRHKYRQVTTFALKGRLLDVGSGTGELLRFFKQKGWDVTGIEPNDSARNYAISQHDVSVFPESYLSSLPANSFDVVSMWHVLEHVSDINERIRALSRVLKTEGVLVVALPNIDSWDANYYGSYWAALDVPRHLFHFSPGSFGDFSNRHGFKVVEKIPMKMDAFYVSLLSEKYKGRGTVLSWVLALINGFRSNINAYRDQNYSSVIYILKKK